MKKTTTTLAIIIIFSSISFAQKSNPTLREVNYYDIGLEYGFDAGLGGYLSFSNLGTCTGCFSTFGISFLYKDDGVDQWGEDYSGTIGANEFSDDIVDEGNSYLTVSGIAGLKITKWFHVLGLVGFQAVTLVQQRRDPTRILSNDGKYYTSFSQPDETGVGIGAGAKFFLPLSNAVALSPTIQFTTLKGVSLSLGVAFN